MVRAAIYVSSLLLLGGIAHAGAQQSAAVHSSADSDCTPPGNFSKRFPKLTEKKALRKVTRRIKYKSPNVLKADNPVTGVEVASNNLYAQTVLGVAGYGKNHTFAAIVQPLEGERSYSIRISDTEYVKGTRPLFFNELAELYVPSSGEVVTVPRSGNWEEGFCGPVNVNEPRSCFNTATGAFAIDRALFEDLAARDPAKPIAITARKRDGTMVVCPYYFSPLSFKAPLLTIDAAYAEALAKDARNRAKR